MRSLLRGVLIGLLLAIICFCIGYALGGPLTAHVLRVQTLPPDAPSQVLPPQQPRVVFGMRWIARTSVCEWRDGEEPRCRNVPSTNEYPSQAACEFVEWNALNSYGLEQRRLGLRVAARVSCVQEFDA